MKRLLIFMLFLLFVVGLTACGNSEDEQEEVVATLGEIVPHYPQHLGSPIVPLEPTPHETEQPSTQETLNILEEPENVQPNIPDNQEPHEDEPDEPANEPAIVPEPEPAVYHDAEVGLFVNGQFLGKSKLVAMEVVEFTVTIRPGTDREDIRQYRGVALADILAYFNIDEGTSLIFHSYDGFAAGITMAEALDRQQAFIAIWQDGQYFAHRGDYWGVAPFQLVMAQDIFAQRFARYITEIVVQ